MNIFRTYNLIQAVKNNKIEDVKKVIEDGVYINEQDKINKFTAIHLASFKKNEEILNFLIEKGADINRQDFYGWTALHWACANEQFDVVKILIEKGADINVKDLNNKTVMDLANNNVKFKIEQIIANIQAKKIEKAINLKKDEEQEKPKRKI